LCSYWPQTRTWRLSRKLATRQNFSDKDLYEAQDMAEKVTSLGGAGLLSRIFLADDGVYFSELSLDHMIMVWYWQEPKL
jgi:hypothetical protein